MAAAHARPASAELRGGRVDPAARAFCRRRGRMAARVGGASTPSSSTTSRRTATRRCGARACSSRSRGSRGAGRDGGHLVVGARRADALRGAGFEVDKAARQRRQAATSASRVRAGPPTRSSARSTAPERGRHASGGTARHRRRGGTAGCGLGVALAEQGWHCTLFSIATPNRPAKARATRAASSTASSRLTTAHARTLGFAPPRFVSRRWRVPRWPMACPARSTASLRLECTTCVPATRDRAPGVPGPAARIRAGASRPSCIGARRFSCATRRGSSARTGGWICTAAGSPLLLRRRAVPARAADLLEAGLQRDGEDWCLLDGNGGVIALPPTVVLGPMPATRCACSGERRHGMAGAAVRGQVDRACRRLALPAPLPVPATCCHRWPPLRCSAGMTAQRGDLDASVPRRPRGELSPSCRACSAHRRCWRPPPAGPRRFMLDGARSPAADQLRCLMHRPPAGSTDQPRAQAAAPRGAVHVRRARLARHRDVGAGARLLAVWVTGAPAPVARV